MSIFKDYVGKELIVDLPGTKLEGVVVDYGRDLTVLYNEEVYLYIPTAHIRQCRLNPGKNGDSAPCPITPFVLSSGSMTYQQMLCSAKDLLVEIAVLGKEQVYGCITEIQKDYFVFHSPIAKTLLVPFEHLKWLALQSRQQTYYSINKEALPAPSNGTVAVTFQAQLKSLVGNFIVIDLANSSHKCGLLKQVTEEHLQLITAQEEIVWHNLQHIQVVQPL